MANAYLSSAVITNEMLRVLHNKSALVKRINTQFDGMFGKSMGATGKVGQTINIRRPPQFTVRSGPVANIQDITETTVPLTMQPEFGVDFAVADFDLTLNIDQFSKRYLEPAAKRLATELDRRIVTAMVAAVSNSVGTPGTPPTSQQAVQQLFLQAGVLLTNAAADMNDRQMILGPSAMATGVLQQFVVTTAASSDASGNLTAIISPAIIAGGAFQNVTARPASGAAITVLGTAGTGYPISLGFVKDAFTLVTTDMDIPAGVDQADKAEQDGISIRYVRAFDITNNRRICRFDILAGFAALRPEWGVRVYAG